MGDAFVCDLNCLNPVYNNAEVLSVSSETPPDMKGVNLLNRSTFKIWRSDETTAQFVLDLKINYPIDLFTFITRRYSDPDLRFFPKFFSDTDSYTLKFDANGGTPGTGAVHEVERNFNMNIQYGYEAYLTEWDDLSDITARYVWGEISAPSRDLTHGYFDLSHIWLGKRFKPKVNFSINSDEIVDDLGSKLETPSSGIVHVSKAEKLREWTFTFNRLEEDEYELAKAQQQWMGSTGVFLIGRTSEENNINNNIMMASHIQQQGISPSSPETFSKRYRVRETR